MNYFLLQFSNIINITLTAITCSLFITPVTVPQVFIPIWFSHFITLSLPFLLGCYEDGKCCQVWNVLIGLKNTILFASPLVVFEVLLAATVSNAISHEEAEVDVNIKLRYVIVFLPLWVVTGLFAFMLCCAQTCWCLEAIRKMIVGTAEDDFDEEV